MALARAGFRDFAANDLVRSSWNQKRSCRGFQELSIGIKRVQINSKNSSENLINYKMQVVRTISRIKFFSNEETSSHSNIFQLRPIMKTFVDAAWKTGRKKRSLNGPKNTKIIDCIIYVASVNAVGKCDAYFVESLKPSKKAAKIHLFTFQTWRHLWKVRHEILFNWIQVFVHFRNNWTNGVVISKRNWLNGKFVVMFLGIPPRYTLECG